MFKRDSLAVWAMALITLFGFQLLAWPLLWYQEISWQNLFNISKTEIWGLPLMLSFGIVFGLLMIFFTEIPFFEKTLASIRNRLSNIELTTFFVFLLSISAGIGEEVFFRGALQPLIGIWATSVVFVAIHGYFSFKNKWLNFFGILLLVFIVFIGWLAEKYSIWFAIMAHFSYDLVLLFYYKKENEQS
jgi:hypothetical protein